MNYTKVDLDTWERGTLFRYYIDDLRMVISLTVDVDAAPLVAFVKERSLPFYPVMIWVVSKVLNAHDEFKYSWDEAGDLIRWDSISPFWADFHPEDRNFTKQVTEYDENLEVFLARYEADRRTNRDLRGVVPDQPKNSFDLSCLPWVRYRHLDLHVFDEGKFLAPVVTWGKYEWEGERAMMPLSMNIHHAVADGFHVAGFFNEVQEVINGLEFVGFHGKTTGIR